MTKSVYEAEYAAYPVRYLFLSPFCRYWFGSWVRCVKAETCDVSVSPNRLTLARKLIEEEMQRRALPQIDLTDAYVEFRTLTELTSHHMLRHGCCFFHAAAFLWHGRAWLLSGPSGVGKSTQFLNWQRCFPGEITVICGDMPLLERRKDGIIWAHPSPWNGKERLGSKASPSAPLGGLVVLEQGLDNRLAPLSARDAIPALISQFILRPDTEAEILALTGLMDAMLRSVPIWKLINRGDDDSTALLRQTLKGGGYDPL